eukprot:TRINITY_DN10632_c0_g1_i5.p3 TRINITY_DN10632_c0_g1~~TRINITY_DN10632_c0_g1_i5.p3  ORF type:complete len:144 (+),score=25.03 TRINITY_DN10632_c0_g1_i5:1838-2269(+)
MLIHLRVFSVQCLDLSSAALALRPSRTYTIAWEDGDTTGRTQEFGLVAKDITPAPEDVGVGSTIFFPQGNYVGNADYNRSDGTHWHLGMIDAVREDDSGQTVYDGHHIKGANDDKWVTFTGSSAFRPRSRLLGGCIAIGASDP